MGFSDTVRVRTRAISGRIVRRLRGFECKERRRSVRSLAAQINFTNNPDRSPLVQRFLGSFMWMDLRVRLLLLYPKTKELGRISDKRKTSVSLKIKIRLATASAAATLYQRCN